MGLINDTPYLAANVTQASTNSGNRRGPIKVALLSLPPRSQALLEFFFAHAGRGTFVATVEETAESAIFDIDTPASRTHWERFHARTGLTGIALAVKAHDVPGALWVQKPVTPAALMAAAVALRPPHFVDLLTPKAPTPAPLDAPFVAPRYTGTLRTEAAEAPRPATGSTPPSFAPEASAPIQATEPAVPRHEPETQAPEHGHAGLHPMPSAHDLERLFSGEHPRSAPEQPPRAIQQPEASDALPGSSLQTVAGQPETADAGADRPAFEAGSPDSAWANRFTEALRSDPLLSSPPESIIEMPADPGPDAKVPDSAPRRLVVKDPTRGLRSVWNRLFGAGPQAGSKPSTPAAAGSARAPAHARSPASVTRTGPAVDSVQPAAADRVTAADVPTPASTPAEAPGPKTEPEAATDVEFRSAGSHAPSTAPSSADRASPDASPAVAPPGDGVAQAVSDANAEAAEPAVPEAGAPETPVSPEADAPAARAVAQPEPEPAPQATVAAAPRFSAAEPASPATSGSPDAGAASAEDPELFGSRGDFTAAEYASRHDLRYDPEAYLVGQLREAFLISAKWRVPTMIDCSRGSLVVDVSRNELHTDFDVAELPEVATTPLLRRTKVRTLTSPEFVRFKQDSASAGATLRLDQQLWMSALRASAGRLPLGAQAQGTVYLMHWPCLTRLPALPSGLRFAALWALRGGSVIETARMFNVPQRLVIAFYNGTWALDLLTDDGSHLERALVRNARNRGLLSRLIGWLRR